jgi:hypothetical protein
MKARLRRGGEGEVEDSGLIEWRGTTVGVGR